MAGARRELLLGVHRHRLGREDLEDCYSQATLELLIRAQRRDGFASRAHIANALEQRFLSRVRDRRRALGGRSSIEAAIAASIPLDGGIQIEIADTRADVERIARARRQLRRMVELARELTPDQRLVLANELFEGVGQDAFCCSHGWTLAKYRKAAQRARARLALLMTRESGCPTSRAPVGQVGRDTPMNLTRPPHRSVPGDATDRLPTRSRGAFPEHTGGREPGTPSSALPAARVAPARGAFR